MPSLGAVTLAGNGPDRAIMLASAPRRRIMLEPWKSQTGLRARNDFGGPDFPEQQPWQACRWPLAHGIDREPIMSHRA
jgi:hypothetical protein